MAQKKIGFGESGWLPALLDEVLAGARESAPLDAHALEARLAELSWRDGALVGEAQVDEFDSAAQRLDAAWLANTARVLALVAAHRLAGASTTPHALAALLATALGEVDLALLLATPEKTVEEALAALTEALERRTYRLGNPPGGLPLHGLATAVDGRHLLRLGLVSPRSEASLRRHAARVQRARSELLATAVEMLAHLLEGTTTAATVHRQVRHLGLTPQSRRQLVRQLQAPRPPADLVGSTPPRLRSLLIEQLVLGVLMGPGWSDAAQERLIETCRAGGLPEGLVASARARGTAMMLAHPRAVTDLAQRELPSGWQETLDGVMDGLADTTEALANEARETGELGLLLTKAAAGHAWTSDERERVREQLVDIAKAIPSLAVVAAPGGSLLLPLLIKVLPFDLRPSSFRPKSTPPPTRRGKT